MGAEFYGEDFQGPDVAPFVGINTFSVSYTHLTLPTTPYV